MTSSEQPEALPEGALGNYVDGEWHTPRGADGRTVRNPANGAELAYLPYANQSDVDAAVTAANAAFDEWRGYAVEERIQPLFRLKSLLEEHQAELAELLVRDMGKTREEAVGELRRGIQNVEVACGIPSLMQAGMVENAAPGIDETAIRQPLGTVAAITPFNFPGMIPLWFLPYAVATGNAFILKPSEQDPLVPQRLFELVDEAGFPDGVVQLVNGGPDTVTALVDHPGVEGISFVGSSPVARDVYETAAAAGKRVQAQGGAKNHVLVAESADLDHAAEQTVSSACACAGERCLANDIALVHEDVYEEFADRVLDVADDQVVGNGLGEPTDIGALISPEHEQRVRNYIQTGIEEGATLLRDGRDPTPDGDDDGNFLGPTVLGNVTADMVVAREELFGPVLGLAAVPSLEAAIDRVNESEFANAASLFTKRGADARRFRAEAAPGNLGVNVGTVAPMPFFHFGGTNESFFGDLHAQGEDAVRFYTDETIYVERWPDATD
jgi:malonate-semialdehyde dehydrogenase (acetylating)/methylmalonate-semialdehyde dehydrogenase